VETSKEHFGELVEIIQYQAAHCASILTHHCWWWSSAPDSRLATTVHICNVCQANISYILEHYGSKCTVVFGG